MPQECTWIMAREEVCSEGGDSDPDMAILGTNAFDNQLPSEEFIWRIFLQVGVHIWLVGVTVESITSGEIGTGHWTGEQRAAVVVVAEECPPGNLQ
jgi:hypothetical protein